MFNLVRSSTLELLSDISFGVNLSWQLLLPVSPSSIKDPREGTHAVTLSVSIGLREGDSWKVSSILAGDRDSLKGERAGDLAGEVAIILDKRLFVISAVSSPDIVSEQTALMTCGCKQRGEGSCVVFTIVFFCSKRTERRNRSSDVVQSDVGVSSGMRNFRSSSLWHQGGDINCFFLSIFNQLIWQ